LGFAVADRNRQAEQHGAQQRCVDDALALRPGP
jgi:hypothetical protein